MKEDRSRTILLVEDEPLIALTEKLTLEKNGYSVVTAATGEAAIEATRTNASIDLILMDIDLGRGIRGTEAAQIILAERDLPLVFLSAHTEPDVVEQTEGITSYGYIVKHTGDTVLLASIRMAFRLYETRRTITDTFTHSLNGMCIHRLVRDADGIPYDCEYLRVNAAFEHHTGLAAQTLIGRTIGEIYPDNEAAAVVALYVDILEGRAASRQEIFFAPSQSWFELSVFPTGQSDEFTVVAVNITERKVTEQRSQRHQRELTEINRIGALSNLSLGIDGVLHRMLELTLQSLGASAGMVFLLDSAQGVLSWSASIGVSQAFMDEFADNPIRIGEGLTGAVAEVRKPIFVAENCSADPRVARDAMRREAFNSFIGVPILAADEVVGVMNIVTHAPERLTEADVPFCAAIGAQAGWAIVNARLLARHTVVQEQLRNSESTLRSILDNMTDVLWSLSWPDFRVRFISPAIEKVYGRSAREFYDDPSLWRRVVHPGDVSTVEDAIEQLRSTGSSEREARVMRPDGAVRWIRDKAWLVYDAEHKPIRVDGIATDISDHKQAERLNEETLRRVTAIMSAVPAAIVVFDRNGRIIDDNPAARLMFRSGTTTAGLAKCGEYINCRHCFERPDGCGNTPQCVDCEIDAAIKTVVRNRVAVGEQDKEVVQHTGESIWIRFNVVPIVLQYEECALLVAQDITGRKHAETELARQVSEKETLLREVHHRVKNNIAGIGSLLSLQAASAADNAVRNALQDAIARISSMQDLYERLLLNDEYRTVSIKDYVQALLESIREIFPGTTHIEIITRLVDFQIDPKHAVSIGMILNELVTNVFKYAFSGRTRGTITVTLAQEGPAITLSVQDNGVGIDSAAQAGQSFGFGLTLVRMLTEQLGGTFTISRKRGTHAEVRFALAV